MANPPDRVKEPEAFGAYVALGPGRTHEQLKDKFGARSVSMKTYKGWSTKHGWVKRAKKHDSRVAERALMHVETSQALDFAKIAAEHDVTPTSVIREFARMGFSNIKNYMRFTSAGDPFIDLQNVSDAHMAAVKEITIEEYKDGRGEDARDVIRTRIKLHDKQTSLERLANLIGVRPPKEDAPNVNVTINNIEMRVEQVRAEVSKLLTYVPPADDQSSDD